MQTVDGKHSAIPDLFEPGLVLFAGPRGEKGKAAVRSAAINAGVNMPEIRVQRLVSDRSDVFAKSYAVDEARAVLVRPDG